MAFLLSTVISAASKSIEELPEELMRQSGQRYSKRAYSLPVTPGTSSQKSPLISVSGLIMLPPVVPKHISMSPGIVNPVAVSEALHL